MGSLCLSCDKFDQREVSTVRLGMLESSGFRKYSTLLGIHLFSRRLCLCHCLCICLCLCICVPNSFLNSYYHKLSENVWVWGCGATRSEIWSNKRTKRKDRATHGPWKAEMSNFYAKEKEKDENLSEKENVTMDGFCN